MISSSHYAVLVVMLLIIGIVANRITLSSLRQYEKHASAFFEKSRALISDDETPLEIVRLIGFLNKRIIERSSARSAFLALWKHRGSGEKHGSPFSDETQLFLKRRPELDNALAETCKSGLKAVAYNSFFFGWLLRRFYFFEESMNATRAESISFDIKSYFEGHPVQGFLPARS